jgi:glycosyltransferase involved in cell wall biosynthesis/peptidoglycan/xylan/chitin deacetylase (PgdA/CDA1 family)
VADRCHFVLWMQAGSRGVIVTAKSSEVFNPTKPATRPIRILYIIDSLSNIGGAELCLLRLTKYLPRDQFECRVLTFNNEDGLLLGKFDCPIYHWQTDNVYDRNAFRVARRLQKLVCDEQIDIVHTFFQTSDLWAGPIAKLGGAKLLISSRRDMGILRQPKHDLGYRLMRGIFDQVQAVSDGVRRWTIENDRIDPDRTITIHNGIDPNLDAPAEEVEFLRRQVGLKAGVPVIANVANFRHVKGMDVLVRAAALVGREAPQARILVAGGFGTTTSARAYASDVLELSRSLGAERWLTFLGQLENVAPLLKLSDMFVLPSRSEGLSNALLEAMVFGLPCIATAVGGNPEVVVDGHTGFLIPSDDPMALADRILRLIRDGELRRTMGAASRERALQRFTLEAMSSRVMAAYQLALEVKMSPVAGRKYWRPLPAGGRGGNWLAGAVQVAARRTGVNACLRHLLLQDRLLVLCYHGVLNRPPLSSTAYNINVLEQEFESHMKFLVRNFHIMTASELVAVVEGRQKLPRRSVVVTFDDGYLNNLTVAAPILLAYSIPAIFHISTDYIGGEAPLWPDEIFSRVLQWPEQKIPSPGGVAVKLASDESSRTTAALKIQEDCKLLDEDKRVAYLEMLRSQGPLPHDLYGAMECRFMNWDDVRELSRQGFEIGSHTVTHPILSRIGRIQLEYELRASKERIERELNTECRMIAYPNGKLRDANSDVWDEAAATGYRVGFTLRRHLATLECPMAINRINVPGNETQAVFESRAAGVYVIQ